MGEDNRKDEITDADLISVLKHAMKLSSIGTFVIDLKTYRILAANDASFELLGKKPRPCEGVPCYKAFFGNDRPCSFCSVDHCAEGESSFDLHVDELDRDLHISSSISPWGEDRQVYVVYVTDVTDSRRAQRTQADKLAVYESVINNTPGALCLFKWDGRDLIPLVVSRQYSELLGAHAKEALENTHDLMFKHVHPDDLGAVQQFVRDALKSLKFSTTLYRSLNETTGEYRWIRVRGKATRQDDGTVYAFASYNDVTEQEVARRQMEVNINKLDALINAIPGGVIVYRVGEAITVDYFSDAVPRLSGHTREEYQALVEKDPITPFVYASDLPRVNKAIEKARATQTPVSIVYRRMSKDGSLMWAQLSAQMISREGDDLIYYAVITRPTGESAMMRALLGDTTTGVMVGSLDTEEVLFANTAWRRLQNIDDDTQVVGKVARQLVTPSMRMITSEEIASLVEGEFRLFHRSRPDGSTIVVHAKRMTWNNELPAFALFAYDITNEIKNAAHLAETNATLTAALRLSAVWPFRIDVPSGTLWIDADRAAVIGIPAKLPGMPEALVENGFIHPDFADTWRDLYNKCLTGQRVEGDIRNRGTKEQGYVWVRVTFEPIVDENGVVAEVLGASMSIEDEKKREFEYQSQLTQHLAAADNAVVSAVVNVTKNKIITNHTAEHAPGQFATTLDQLFEGTQAAIIGNEAKATFVARFSRKGLETAFAQGHDHISMRYRIEGYPGWLALTADVLFNPDTGDVEAFLRVRDITESMRAELMVKTLTEVDYETIFTFDADTGRANESSLSHQDSEVTKNQIEAGDAQEGVMMYLRDNCLDDDLDRVMRENSLDYIRERLSVKPVHYSHYAVQQDGQRRQKRALYTYLSGDPTTLLGAVQDVTEQWKTEIAQKIRLEEALQEANAASTAKSVFLSNMSHEIRTPMNAITGMTKLAEDVPGNPALTLDYLSNIDVSGHYLLNVINDVLDMSRIESGRLELHPEWVRPADIINPCFVMLTPAMKEKHIEFVTPNTAPVDDIEVFVDPMRTKQVVMNLLNNALKFTPEGGRIEVTAKGVSMDGDISVDELSVKDTGCGMSAEFLPKVFEPFEQERTAATQSIQGTGLGLALVKRIVEAMGGSVWVESEMGKGSTFTFCWKHKWRPAQNHAAKQQAAIDPKETLAGCTVLIAEDHPLNRTIACALLEKMGVHCLTAENGIRAVEVFEASEPGSISAILMDIRMPGRDGLEATRAIRASKHPDAQSVPIVAMSANAFDEDARKSIDAGMNRHLAKPVDPDLMYRALAECISENERKSAAEK